VKAIAVLEDNMNLKGQTAVVVGASRGFGRGIVESLIAKEMIVTAVARNRESLEDLERRASARTIVADATDEQQCVRILAEIKPDLLVLSAGTTLDLRPLHEHTWETFSRPWEVDTKLTSLWVRAALRAEPGPQHVVVFGSGAALFGSPLSGGYAGAKKMNAFIAEYAAGVASRTKRSIRFHCLIPPMSPHTEFGAAAAQAYAKMAGQTLEDFVKQLPSPPMPADIGASVVALHQNPKKWNEVSYRVSADGMAPVDE
jgi:NAD(P)-dependent dehydrogenase (short-subunit alcohol dehydrogenase family)